MRRPPRARRAWVAQSAWWVMPPVLVWALWLLSCVWPLHSSTELLIAGMTIAGAPQMHSPMVNLPLVHYSLLASDTRLSPAHTDIIHEGYWLAGPPWLRQPLGRFIPDA
jgi:hypothetical protein